MSSRSPYFKIFSEAGRDLNFLQPSKLKYVYDEALEEQSTVVMESQNPSYVDDPDIQEDRAIIIEWGYIGEVSSISRIKAYIIDSEVELDENLTTITLRCSSKTAYLKQDAKVQVRDNASLDEYAKELADTYSLKYINGVDGQVSAILETGFARPRTDGYRTYQNPSNPNDPRNGEIILAPSIEAIESARVRRTYVWRTYDSLPQANKSDAQLLSDMQYSEPLPNLVISGRGDELHIKTRDFNQAPIKSYTYKREDGRLLKFRALIENSKNRKAALTTSTNGWNSENKEFIQNASKNTLDGNPAMGENIPISIEDVLAEGTEVYPGNTNYFGLYKEYQTTDDNGEAQTSLIKTDSIVGQTFVTRLRRGTVPKELVVDGYKLEQDVISRIPSRGIIPFKPEKMVHTIEGTPGNIAGSGLGEQEKAKLNLVKAYATFEGARYLIEGKIIVINGVSRKYSGAWYIMKASHSVDSAGWLVEVELTKNATIGKTPNPSDFMGDINSFGKELLDEETQQEFSEYLSESEEI